MKHPSFLPFSKPQYAIHRHARPHRELPAALVTSLVLLLGSTRMLSGPVRESPSHAAAETAPTAPEPPLKPDTTALLAQLQSDDLETRYAAMRQLGPSIDPRVPDACLSVLKNPDSVRICE